MESKSSATNLSRTMANKLYFRTTEDELCYPLSYHMGEAESDEIELYEAIPDTSSAMFFCKAESVVCENGFCGRGCPDYDPMNKRSGMCRHRSNKLYTHGNKVKFNVK